MGPAAEPPGGSGGSGCLGRDGSGLRCCAPAARGASTSCSRRGSASSSLSCAPALPVGGGAGCAGRDGSGTRCCAPAACGASASCGRRAPASLLCNVRLPPPLPILQGASSFLPKDWPRLAGCLKPKFWLLAVWQNGRGGVAQRRALRRAVRADDHRDWRALCQVHVPARGCSAGPLLARQRRGKIAHRARRRFAAPPCRRPAPAPAAAQRPARCAPPPRARWRAQRPCSGGRPAPRCQMGTPGAPRPPRRKLSRWPAGRRGRGAGAAAQAPASSGGVLASFLLRHVGVCAGADRCGVLLLCVASQGGFSQRCR